MRAAILRSREGWHIEQLEAAFGKKGVETVKVSITDLVLSIGGAAKLSGGGVDLVSLDALIVRVIPLGSMEQLMFRLNALHRLANLGVKVINHPAAIEKTVDKSCTSHLLADAGLPTPETVVCERFSDAMEAFEKMGDVIVKPLSGSCGSGLSRVSDPDLAYRVFRTMEQNRFVYYLQRFIGGGGSDTRVFTIGGEVAGAMKRSGNGWKNNYARGAKVETADPTPDQAEMAVAAAEMLGLDYAGVDFLAGDGGTDYILEVNGIPGWKGLQKTNKINIADKIVDLALDE